MAVKFVRHWLLAAAVGCSALPAMAAQVLGGYAPLAGQNGLQSDLATPPALTQTALGTLTGTLELIVWWGYRLDGNDPAGDAFEVTLNGAAQTGSLGRSGAGAGLTRYELDVADLAWGGGAATLALINNDPDTEWYWQFGNLPGAQGVQAFQLVGTAANAVPEPASLALVLASLGGVALARRRRRG